MAGGRPSKYKPEYAEQASKLCALGATYRDLAEFFEVAESTISLWKIEHREFSESLKLAKEAADARVEQSLYRRALGYSHDSVHVSNYQGAITMTPIVEHFPPDTTACIFWLKNRKPEEWRDIKAIEHDIGKRLEKLAERDLDNRLAELLRKAGAGPVAPGKTTAH